MHRLTCCSLALFALTAQAQSPEPLIQNGRVEMRSGAAIDREISSLSGGPSDPGWVGWRVPIADGYHGGCCVYGDDIAPDSAVRGCFVEHPIQGASSRPQTAATPAPVALEAGSGLVVLLRVVNGHVDRLRHVGDDCPLDAGGRTVFWLQNVSGADSVRYLMGLVASSDAITRAQAQRLRSTAISAVGLHGEAAATDALRGVAQQHTDANLRAEAAYWLAQRGEAAMKDALHLLDTGAPDVVKRRTVQGVARLPEAASTPVLLDLAGAGGDLVVRKAAVQALGRSKDPRARAYVESLLK